MPAGRGQVCEECYWRELIRKRIHINRAIFPSIDAASMFELFGEWLVQRVGSKRAAQTIHRYVQFFSATERQWDRIPAYAELLAQFGAAGLRCAKLPMEWLKEKYCVVPDPQLRETDSERRRIAAMVSTVPPASIAGKALAEYRRALESKVEVGYLSIRSMRLALKPAASLLSLSDANGCTLPNQKVLDSYLRDSPGQRASLMGFIVFLRERFNISLQAELLKGRATANRKRKLEQALKEFIRNPEAIAQDDTRWVLLGLEYFHGKKASRSEKRAMQVSPEGNGISVELGGQRFWLPRP
jgi:hypothetical protein